MTESALGSWQAREFTTEETIRRLDLQHEQRVRWGIIKQVVCELCQRGLHRDCVLPCTCEHRQPKMSEGVMKMGLTKHSIGDVLREPEDNAKVAKQNWTEEDAKALAKENADADEPDE